MKNREVKRRALTQEEIAREARHLVEEGHKRLLLVAGEAYPAEGFDYVLRCTDTIYAPARGHGGSGRVNVTRDDEPRGGLPPRLAGGQAVSASAPRGQRLHIGFFGRRNVGKSSLLNAVTRQEVLIVSAIPGTTTDPVEKPMELAPIGPARGAPTAGGDDEGALGARRIEKTRRALDRADLAVVAPAEREALEARRIVGELASEGDLVVLVVPVDKEAPKGRLILPHVQTIRDLLDAGAYCLVVMERELPLALARLKAPPRLVVTDSQAFLKAAADTPPGTPLTPFSILFARFQGDLSTFVAGAFAVEDLRHGDRVLVAEARAHRPAGEDIGRVKIPRWLKQYTGLPLEVALRARREARA